MQLAIADSEQSTVEFKRSLPSRVTATRYVGFSRGVSISTERITYIKEFINAFFGLRSSRLRKYPEPFEKRLQPGLAALHYEGET